MKKILNLLIEYKGLILFILIFMAMLNMYVSRIEEINNAEQNQTNIVEKR